MRKRISIAVLCVCAVIFAVCVILIAGSYMRKAPSAEEFKAAPEVTAPPVEAGYVSPVDFEALRAVNPEVVGWICIDGTEIDYPILCCPEDNSKYLNTDFRGREDKAGSIYIESFNSPDFSDFNTVIYGHNMRAGTMFADLHRYEDGEFFFGHQTVRIYLPDRELIYKVFASRIVSNRHILSLCDNSDPDSCRRYLNAVLSAGNLVQDRDVQVTADDRILSLATCWVNPDYRYAVYAVLTDVVS
ncbi:MAG: class B sortase [Oscillospiraceae bacterium]|nr:class B sortase [Oscillospiraceae bacterium]